MCMLCPTQYKILLFYPFRQMLQIDQFFGAKNNSMYLVFCLAPVYKKLRKVVVVKLETFRKHVAAAAADYDESKHHLKL